MEYKKNKVIGINTCDLCEEPDKGKMVFDYCPITKKRRGYVHKECKKKIDAFKDNEEDVFFTMLYLMQSKGYFCTVLVSKSSPYSNTTTDSDSDDSTH